MHFLDQGPHRLAEVVLRALSLNEMPGIDPALLLFFFDVLYEASFRSDAGQPLAGSVVWQDPATLPLTSLSLIHPVPFNVNSVVSLAQGMDPQASALAVHAADPQHPVIHGLVNYSAVSPVLWATEEAPGRSATFRAAILGPGHLLVDVGLDQPVELMRNHLYTDAHDVLRRGPVRDRLSAELAQLLPTLKAQLPPDIVSSLFEAEALSLAGGSVLINEYDWSEMLERLWTDALVQVLLAVFQNQRGGAVLITPSRMASAEEVLTLPYATVYSQLRMALEQRLLFAMIQQVISAKALSEWTRPLLEMSPEDQSLHEPDLMAGPPGSDQEIRQTVAFIASLACVEGILLLTPALDVSGFGGQSIAGPAPEEVYLAGDELATESELSALSYRSFGPRNQALIRHCWQDQEAIAFAFTQDGDLRAIMRLEEKVIVWNRVRLHRL